MRVITQGASMEIPSQRSESLSLPKHAAVRLCEQLFEQAVWNTLEEPEKHFILQHNIHSTDSRQEYIALVENDESMHLFRTTPEDEKKQTVFPFFLRHLATAFDAESGEPFQIQEIYHLDVRGSFHQEIVRGSRTLLKPVDDHTNLRLLQFLHGSQLAHMIVFQPQE